MLETATAFATLVTLIGQFRAEKGASTQVEFNEFMEWLIKTNHNEIKGLLDLNAEATIYIKALLTQDHKIFKEKLDNIYAAITAFASNIEGFDKLAKAINPNNSLSPQAINILQQFQQSGASKILEVNGFGGTNYIFLDGEGYLDIAEPRFFDSDISTLLKYELLLHEYSSEGKNIYIFTRAASELVRTKSS